MKNFAKVTDIIIVRTSNARYMTVAQKRTGANIVLNCFLRPIIKVKLSKEMIFPMLYRIANAGTLEIKMIVDTTDKRVPVANAIPNAYKR